jgi:predicted Fe-Mo cluster-binding NifX family protein
VAVYEESGDEEEGGGGLRISKDIVKGQPPGIVAAGVSERVRDALFQGGVAGAEGGGRIMFEGIPRIEEDKGRRGAERLEKR